MWKNLMFCIFDCVRCIFDANLSVSRDDVYSIRKTGELGNECRYVCVLYNGIDFKWHYFYMCTVILCESKRNKWLLKC